MSHPLEDHKAVCLCIPFQLRLAADMVHSALMMVQTILDVPMNIAFILATAIAILLLFQIAKNQGAKTSPEDDSEEHDLVSDLLRAYSIATFHDTPIKYIPEDAIRTLVTRKAIERELSALERSPNKNATKFSRDRERRSQLATWISTEARKLYAVALHCDLDAYSLLESMIAFRNHELNDDSLPFNSPLSTEIFSPRIWKPLKLETFYERQWKVKAPIFSPREYDYDLPAESIFPFTSHGAVPKDGAFSSVYRVTIHKAHNEHPRLNDVGIPSMLVGYLWLTQPPRSRSKS